MAIRSLVKRASFAEPWPERPAAKRQERETRGSAMAIRSLVKRASLRSRGPSGPAAKRQERENGSTSLETTGHLSVHTLGAATGSVRR